VLAPDSILLVSAYQLALSFSRLAMLVLIASSSIFGNPILA
jgi:hypothetical protein